jgi:hypothetical protein
VRDEEDGRASGCSGEIHVRRAGLGRVPAWLRG